MAFGQHERPGSARPGVLRARIAAPENESMRPIPPGIETRLATRADAETVTLFVRAGLMSYKEWAPDWEIPDIPPERRVQLRDLFASDEAWILLAFDGDELVGVASISLHVAADPDPLPPGTIRLWQMFTAPRLHGSGLAGALHDRALEAARERGYERMTLWAAEGAARARRFYEREGWTLTGKTQPDSPFGLPIVEYQKGV